MTFLKALIYFAKQNTKVPIESVCDGTNKCSAKNRLPEYSCPIK